MGELEKDSIQIDFARVTVGSLGRLRAVVLNYNRAAMTSVCVDSILAQKYSGPLDVVVVDNHSAEDDFEELKGLLPPEVTIVRCERNKGYAAGNNVGVRLESSPLPEYIMILNNDVTLGDEHTCEKLIRALMGNTHRVAASPLVDTIGIGLSPNAQIQVRRVPDFVTVLVVASWWLRRVAWLKPIVNWYTYNDARPYPLDREIECDSINGSCFVIRRDFYERIRYFDEGTFLYYEEIILGKQIKDLGMRCCLVTSIVVKHYQGATTGQRQKSFKLRMSMEMARSQYYYCRNHLHVNRVSLWVFVCIWCVEIFSWFTYQWFQRLGIGIKRVLLGL